MQWTVVIAFLRLLAFCAFGALVTKTVIEFVKNKPVWKLWGAITFFVLGLSFFGGSLASPKISIDQPYSPQRAVPVVIETPPPRTETLEGFKPLPEK